MTTVPSEFLGYSLTRHNVAYTLSRLSTPVHYAQEGRTRFFIIGRVSGLAEDTRAPLARVELSFSRGSLETRALAIAWAERERKAMEQ